MFVLEKQSNIILSIWSYELRLAHLILVVTFTREIVYSLDNLCFSLEYETIEISAFFIGSVPLVSFSTCVCVSVRVRVCVWFHPVTKVSKNPSSLLASLTGDARTTNEMAIGSIKSEVIFVESIFIVSSLQFCKRWAIFLHETLWIPSISREWKGGGDFAGIRPRRVQTRGFVRSPDPKVVAATSPL